MLLIIENIIDVGIVNWVFDIWFWFVNTAVGNIVEIESIVSIVVVVIVRIVIDTMVVDSAGIVIENAIVIDTILAQTFIRPTHENSPECCVQLLLELIKLL